MSISCCKGCADRRVGCHGTCERYAAERGELDRKNARKRQYAMRTFEADNYTVNTMVTLQRRYGGRRR